MDAKEVRSRGTQFLCVPKHPQQEPLHRQCFVFSMSSLLPKVG